MCMFNVPVEGVQRRAKIISCAEQGKIHQSSQTLQAPFSDSNERPTLTPRQTIT